MIKVLLIYPEMPTTYWSFKYALAFTGKRASFPPLGLITVAALFPAGYEAKLVDMNVSALSDSDIREADLVFVSAMMIQRESFEKVVARCGALGKPVVAGGPYPTSSYKKIGGVDHFILGEAENLLAEFLADYERGEAQRVYADESKPDIALTPVPRFDLLETKKYFSMSLQYSRGCPFSCEFCDIIELFGRKPRTKTPEQLLRELDAIYETGYRGSLFIVDDNFIGNRNEVKKMLPRLIEWQRAKGFPFNFFTEASVNLSDDAELMKMMVASGFDMVFLGIETPVEATLVDTGKKQNTRGSLLESVRRIQRSGLEVCAGFIIGFDSDPEDIFDRQIAFIQDSGIVMAMVGLLTALPGTRLHRRLLRENRIINDGSGNNTHDLEMNFTPVMNEDILIAGYRRVLRHIYSPENYFLRCVTLMDHMPKHDSTVRRITWQDIKALVSSLVRQTLSPYGFQYLKFLATAARKDIRLFPDAVRMAIMGHHFFKITKQTLAGETRKERAAAMRTSSPASDAGNVDMPVPAVPVPAAALNYDAGAIKEC